MSNANALTMKDSFDTKAKIALGLSAAAIIGALIQDNLNGRRRPKGERRKPPPLFWLGVAGTVATLGWIFWRARKLRAAMAVGAAGPAPSAEPASAPAPPAAASAPSMTPDRRAADPGRPTRKELAAARSLRSRLERHARAARLAQQAAAEDDGYHPMEAIAPVEDVPVVVADAPFVTDDEPAVEDAPMAADAWPAAEDAPVILAEDARLSGRADGDDAPAVSSERMAAILDRLTLEERAKLDQAFMALSEESIDRISARLSRLGDDLAADFLRDLLRRHSGPVLPAATGGA